MYYFTGVGVAVNAGLFHVNFESLRVGYITIRLSLCISSYSYNYINSKILHIALLSLYRVSFWSYSPYITSECNYYQNSGQLYFDCVDDMSSCFYPSQLKMK